MFLYLNEYGYKVSKRKEFLAVEHSNGEKEEFLISNLTTVYFAGEGRISKSIIIELTRRNIDTMILEKGKPMIYLFPTSVKPKMWNLWKKQILLDPRKKSLLAKRFVLNAIKSKANLLSELAKNRKRTNRKKYQQLTNYRNRIRGIERKVKTIRIRDFKKLRKVLMGWEGFSAKLYFAALKHVIPENFGYKGIRTRRPPRDLFNASISFGYGYLKYLIERKLIFLGINPYYGILHQQSDKIYPFLTFDIMEGFRHSFVDRIVIGLISKRVLNAERHSRRFNGSIYLNKFGIVKLSNALEKEKIKNLNKLISSETKYLLNVISK